MDYIIRPVRQDDIDALASVESICFPEAEAATKSSLRERILFQNVFSLRKQRAASSALSTEWQPTLLLSKM